MMMFHRLGQVRLLHWAGGLLLAVLVCQSPSAYPQGTQNSRNRTGAPASAAATKKLDVESVKVELDFLKKLEELAAGYEEAGDLAKSKSVLETILKLRPDADKVKEKIQQIDESVFKDNDTTFEVDVAKGWVSSGVVVAKEKSVRVEAAGVYKYIINESVGPDGFPSKDPTSDAIATIPAGALMAMVAPPPGSRNQNRDKPKPFLVGNGGDFSPESGGLLLLRVNVPPSAKCIGKIKIKVSGHFMKIGTEE